MHNLNEGEMTVFRAIHGSDRFGFGVDPHPIRLNRVNGIWTRGRLKVRVEPGGTGHWLNRSEPSGDFGV